MHKHLIAFFFQLEVLGKRCCGWRALVARTALLLDTGSNTYSTIVVGSDLANRYHMAKDRLPAPSLGPVPMVVLYCIEFSQLELLQQLRFASIVYSIPTLLRREVQTGISKRFLILVHPQHA
jgi:hypothetical protein